MSQAGFLQALEQFPKDSINDEICELMQPYFDAEDYNQESAKRVCIQETLHFCLNINPGSCLICLLSEGALHAFHLEFPFSVVKTEMVSCDTKFFIAFSSLEAVLFIVTM